MKRLIALLGLLGCGSEHDIVTDPNPNDWGDDLPPLAIPSPYQRAHVGQPVALDASQSQDTDGEVVGFAWTVLSTPEGALASITGADTAEASLLTDTLGVYELGLVVTDNDGRPSENLASTVVEVVTWRDLEVRLDWDATTDLDVHLVGPEGVYFGAGDCWYGEPEPDWAVEGLATDDPTFASDIEDGVGTEVIELPAPEAGEFQVLVHFYNPRGLEANWPLPNLDVWLEGARLEGGLGPRLTPGDVWVAGTVDSVTGAWTSSDEITTHEDLGGPPYNY